MATLNEDWRSRLPHDDHLHGLEWCRSQYAQPSPTWDHDHCEFCWRRFAEPDKFADAIPSGWTDVERQFHWVCEDCFQYFRQQYEWKVRI